MQFIEKIVFTALMFLAVVLKTIFLREFSQRLLFHMYYTHTRTAYNFVYNHFFSSIFSKQKNTNGPNDIFKIGRIIT